MIVELLDVTRRRAGDRFVLEMNGTIDAYWGCERVKQAVHNLLENALKYGTADTPITVRAEEALGRVILQVHNAGPHIPADEQAKLFHPFSRAVAAEHSRKRGWGLGLMLAQTIAEAHGGSASVDSAEGRGTTFTFDVLRDVRDYKPPPADTGNALS